MTIRTDLKAGGLQDNHNQAVRVRSTLKARGLQANHNNF